MADAPSSAAVLVDRVHSIIDELQTVNLTQCSDTELIDVAKPRIPGLGQKGHQPFEVRR